MRWILIGIGFVLLLGSLVTGCVTTYAWIAILDPPSPMFQASLAHGVPKIVTDIPLGDGEYSVRVESFDGSTGACSLEVRTDRGDLVGRDEERGGTCVVFGRTLRAKERWIAHATWKGKGSGYVSVYPDKDFLPSPLDKMFGATLLAGIIGLVTMVWGLLLSFRRHPSSLA
jgi:hypothetical protein